MNRAQSVDVVVQLVTYNSAKTIGACIRSVLNQSYTQYCIVVVDNASTDDTRHILTTLHIPVVANRTNAGYAYGHNQALEKRNSRYVLTLNPDVMLQPDFLEKMVSHMDKAGPRVGSAQALLYRVNGMKERSTIVDSAGLYMTPTRQQKLRLSGQNHTKIKKQYIFGPDGAAAFYRRSMLEEINLGDGVFDTDFFMHKEDVDVCWRAQLRGWQSLVIPDAVAYHIRTFRSGQRTHIHAYIRMLTVRNRYYLMMKNELPLLFLRDCILILLYDIAMLTYIMCFERTSLAAYGAFWKNIPALLSKRVAIQRTKKVGVRYMAQWFHWRPI